MSGTWHPDGCRCSGCRQPAGCPPARPLRPAPGPAPVYRRPRSHAYSCRCPRCARPASVKNGDYGLIGPGLVFLAVAYPVLCWPAWVWHGYSSGGDGYGWRWDIHSTYACLTWWGILAFIVVLSVLADKAVRRAPPAPRRPEAQWLP